MEFGRVLFRSELRTYFEEVGLNPDEAVFTGAVKCRTWEASPTRTVVKACAPYLHQELALLPDTITHVLVMGNEALQATLGKSGITKYRSKEYDLPAGMRTITAIPTIADRQRTRLNSSPT